MKRSLRMRTIGLALGLASTGLSFEAVHAAANEWPSVPYIEVTAEAETRVTPDRAHLDFGVMTRADTAAGAAQQNAARMKAVLAAVRGALEPKAQIGTGVYSLRAEYGPPREGAEPRITGYVATNVVRLETAELTKVADVIDAAIKAGANQVTRLAFGLSDAATPRRTALRDAVQRAQGEAETIAAALKATLGPVVSITDQDIGPVRPLAQDAVMMRAQAASATPIEPGLVSVRARVVLRVQIAR